MGCVMWCVRYVQLDKMPKLDGLGTLRALRGADFPIIVITAHSAVESAIEATQLGAVGYLSKPFDMHKVSRELKRALHNTRLAHEVHHLTDTKTDGYGGIMGQSRAMRRVFETLARLEEIDAPTVLLTGES